jgi:hypothetical protein
MLIIESSASRILVLVRRTDDPDSWWTIRSPWIDDTRWEELGLADPTDHEDRGSDAGKHPRR